MAIQDTPPLSRFLRIALLTGATSAVRIHIDRGDDLNARDDKGQTPLMLSAARNKASICKLLLDAGADADLLDPVGRSALNIALGAGATDAAAVIEAARMPQTLQDDAFREPCGIYPDEQSAAFLEQVSFDPSTITLNLDSEKAEFDLAGWVAEEALAPPEDDPTLSATASEIQSAISEHAPIDTSADWDGLEDFLPERATPLPRAEDAEARERLRLVFLRAIREGSVPAELIDDLARGPGGEPDSEAFALLNMVINDLGAVTDDRFEYRAPHESFAVFVTPEEKPDEEDALDEAMAFVDELEGHRNDPLRIYQRELQGEALLTAEAEIALGQAMERGVEKALDALAAWPAGIGSVLIAAKKVACGAKRLRWLSSGPPIELHEAETISSGEPGTESEPTTDIPGAEGVGDPQFDLDAKESIDELEELRVNAELLSGLAVGASQEAPEWHACREAITSLGLTRSFLMALTDSKLAGEPEPALAFNEAMNDYSRARDQMAVANLKLVYSIAKKYMFSGQPLDDLLQEGNIGLIKAVDRYDWRRGFKFSTYATWWIRQQVGRYVADKGKTIRLPVHVYEATQRIAQAVRAFELRHGEVPTVEEIAELVGLPIKKVLTLKRVAVEPMPLHEIDGLDDCIAADAKDAYIARDPMDIVEDIQMIGVIDRFLETIKPQEARVLRMRFGIGTQESMTLDEIGKRLDMTRERVRQIEAAALRKMKHPAPFEPPLRELKGASPQTGQIEERSDGSGDEDDDHALADASGMPLPLKPARVKARPVRPNSSTPTALEKLLNHSRDIGISVEDKLVGADRRIWVHITELTDNHSRKIARKLIEHGFIYWPGKGYWR
jgi:RNA polymerase primary sigma factor